MNHDSNIQLASLEEMARQKQMQAADRIDQLGQELDRRLMGKTRGGLILSIVGSCVWLAAVLAVYFTISDLGRPVLNMIALAASVLYCGTLLTGNILKMKYFGSLLSMRDGLLSLSDESEASFQNLSQQLSEQQSGADWDLDLRPQTYVMEEAARYEALLQQNQEPSHGLLVKLRPAAHYAACLAWSLSSTFFLADLAAPLLMGLEPALVTISIYVSLVLAAAGTLLGNLFLLRMRQLPVNNLTAFAMLMGPVLSALLTALVYLLLELVAIAIGVAFGGLVIFGAAKALFSGRRRR